jgi:DNA topoisomerase-3
MEVQMKAICEGRTTRQDVVEQNLEQYRAVFNRTVQQISVLKSVRLCQYSAPVCSAASLM